MTTPTTGVWTYRENMHVTGDLTGYKVEAQDGGIGKIDKASNDVGSACIVVDTGPWILGKKVMIPAGTIRDVDPDTETTKEEIKNAPEYDEDMFDDQAYRDRLGMYYGDR